MEKQISAGRSLFLNYPWARIRRPGQIYCLKRLISNSQHLLNSMSRGRSIGIRHHLTLAPERRTPMKCYSIHKIALASQWENLIPFSSSRSSECNIWIIKYNPKSLGSLRDLLLKALQAFHKMRTSVTILCQLPTGPLCDVRGLIQVKINNDSPGVSQILTASPACQVVYLMNCKAF